MNMTKIQKLTYIAYGTYLTIKDERLTDEHPQAWSIPSCILKFKK
jgi:uncharacterized phage-associated protein